MLRTLVLAAVATCAVAASATPSDARVIRYQGRTIWVNPANRVALNPQPLPPRWSVGDRFNRVTLNPQPLPPRTIYRYR